MIQLDAQRSSSPVVWINTAGSVEWVNKVVHGCCCGPGLGWWSPDLCRPQLWVEGRRGLPGASCPKSLCSRFQGHPSVTTCHMPSHSRSRARTHAPTQGWCPNCMHPHCQLQCLDKGGTVRNLGLVMSRWTGDKLYSHCPSSVKQLVPPEGLWAAGAMSAIDSSGPMSVKSKHGGSSGMTGWSKRLAMALSFVASQVNDGPR